MLKDDENYTKYFEKKKNFHFKWQYIFTTIAFIQDNLKYMG